MKTGRLLAERLNLAPEQHRICFQSRFGKAEWLQPYTAPTLEALGKAGTRRVDVICPGFVADCLETLEEIAIEGKASFLANGGKEYHYIPALNEEHVWLAALASLAERHLGGWPSKAKADAGALAASAWLARTHVLTAALVSPETARALLARIAFGPILNRRRRAASPVASPATIIQDRRGRTRLLTNAKCPARCCDRGARAGRGGGARGGRAPPPSGRPAGGPGLIIQ